MRLIHTIHRAEQTAAAKFAVAVDQRMTTTQLILLDAVERSGEAGPSQTDLVRATGVDRSTLADMVRRMVKRGLLVRRRRKTDARCYSIRLTDDGAAALAIGHRAAEEAERHLLAVMPAMRALLAEPLPALAAE